MKLADYTGPDGTRHLVWLRDRDPEEQAQALGLPHDPPDLGALDLPSEQAQALHNELVARRLVIWRDAVDFKTGLNEAIQAVGLDGDLGATLYRLYKRPDPPRYPPADWDLQRALGALPCDQRQRDCIRQVFARAGIRTLRDVENAPTRVGHTCGLDIYQVVAWLTGMSR